MSGDPDEGPAAVVPVLVEMQRYPRRVYQATVRREMDATLWDSLSPAEQAAAEAIEAGFRLLVAGLTARVPSLGAPRGRAAPGLNDRAVLLIAEYRAWVRACPPEISPLQVIDVVAFGRSCRSIDREHRRRKGWARANLAAGLAVYCRSHGWR